MKKRFSLAASMLLVLTGMLSLPFTVSAMMGNLRISFTGPSDITRARLYVNGRYKGFIYRGRSLSVMVQSGRSHVVRVYRRKGGDFYQRTRVVSMSGRNRNVTLLLRKREASSGGRLRLRLSSGSLFSSARVYVNGVYKGTVYRSSTRSFSVPSGYVNVRVRRMWRGRRYEYRKRIYVRRGGSVFRIVSMQGNNPDGPDGDGERGRSRLRAKISNSSSMPSASLYVNGRFVGRVYRNGYRTFTIPSGNVRIYASRTWRGVRYRSRTYRKYVGSGRRIYLLLRMQEQ